MIYLMTHFGFLRISLAVLTIASVFLVPEPNAEAILSWPEVVPTLIAPAIAPLIFMVLVLDILMSRIMASGGDDFVRARFRRITWVNIALLIILLARWVPFFMESLARPV